MDNPGIDVSDVHVEDNENTNSTNDARMRGRVQTEQNDNELEYFKEKLERHFRGDLTKTCDTGRKKRNRVPWKFLIAFFKIIFITIQLVRFGDDRTEFVNFLDKNSIALKNVILKDWTPTYETMPYPPSTGKYAVYDINDLNKHIEHAVDRIYSLPTTSVGSFFIRNENDAVQVCVEYYRKGVYNQTNKRLQIDLEHEEDCKYVGKKFASDFGLNVTIEELMGNVNGVLVRLLSTRVKFAVESIYVRKVGVQCFNIDGEILFDNREINGQMIVTLTTNLIEFDCQGTTLAKAEPWDIALYILVLLLSVLSFFFSGHSLYNSAKLIREIKTNKKIELSWKGIWQILRIRDGITAFSDLCSLGGTIIKIILDNKDTLPSTGRQTLYDACGILLSIGCFFVWIGILHYLNSFKSFYLLFAVIENSAFSVLQFLFCIIMIYFGFALCGWIVLGPYHLKFATLGSTVQSLLALVNGDEIFVTFTAVEGHKTTALVFNSIFIGVFIFVFTIVALNVFIAIFLTTYEEIQKYQNLDRKMKDGNSEDQFDGLSEIQKLLRRYLLPRFGKIPCTMCTCTKKDSTSEQD